MDAYYVLHHMQEFVRDKKQLLLPSQSRVQGKDWANCSDDDLINEFYRIQTKLATIIYKDVYPHDGMFHAVVLTWPDVDTCLDLQRDSRPFNKFGDVLPDMPAASKR